MKVLNNLSSEVNKETTANRMCERERLCVYRRVYR